MIKQCVPCITCKRLLDPFKQGKEIPREPRILNILISYFPIFCVPPSWIGMKGLPDMPLACSDACMDAWLSSDRFAVAIPKSPGVKMVRRKTEHGSYLAPKKSTKKETQQIHDFYDGIR